MDTPFLTKSAIYLRLLTALFFLFPILAQSQTIYINEFMASNSNTIADANGGFDDWVELYNSNNTDVNISDFYISDDASNPTKRQLPNNSATLTIPANGYLLLWFDAEPLQGADHVDLKLGAGGEDIVLTAANGTTVIDSYTFGAQTPDISEGRATNGGSSWGFFVEPTPGSSNGVPSGNNRAATPVANNAGGLYNNSITVTLSSATVGADIHYTLDGSVPTESSPEYGGSLTFTDITPLRAVAFASGLLPSKTMTESYLVNVEHDFAIIALSTEPDYLFDEEIGVFGNPTVGNEHPAHIAFYEPDGTLGFSQEMEIENQGAATLGYAQKSLKLKAKASLGSEYINYAIFPDLPYDKYRSILIRQSGQDWRKSNFRDAMIQSLAGDLTDVGNLVEKPDLDLQSYRPSIVYINGVYWGIYNVREQVTWKYVDTHYGLDEDEIYVAERNSGGVEGDVTVYNEFKNYLENNTFTSEANYQTLKKKLDVDHFLDHMIHGIYSDNNDWPGNNSKFWRPRSADGKWRFFTKDMDFGFGLRPLNASWNSGDFTTDMISITLAPNSTEYYNPPSSTLLFRKVMENGNAKVNFINRTADLLNTIFETDRVVARINDFEDLYTPEYQAHLDLWNGGWNQHAMEVEVLRTFAGGRDEAVRGHVVDYFSEVDGLTQVTLNANPTNGGSIRFSTIRLSESSYPWSGTYFRGIDIPVSAKANKGYVLSSWSDAALGNATQATVNFSSSSNNLTANFEFGSTATDPIVINEINYNSPDFPNGGDWIELHNPNASAVDISGWYLEEGSGDYFGLPANTIIAAGGYLLLVEDKEEFQAVYPSVTAVYGGFGDNPGGFKLSNNSESLSLKNANGALIDEVIYDDESPWPTEPDGEGPTLQLSNPALNNTLAGSWIAYSPTPGSLNGVTPTTQDQVIFFPEIADQYTFALLIDPEAYSTSGLSITYSIVSGPATIFNNKIQLSGIPETVVVEATQSGNASYQAASPVQRSFLVQEFNDAAEDYCESKGAAPWQEWISNVTFGSINHNSSKDKYGAFTNIGTYVGQGQSIPLSITADYSWQNHEEYFRVWIDYNQDGDFEDAGETVFSETNSNTGPIISNITIPQTATLGITRMRVSMQRGAYADPCELFANGEVEDYTIIIEEGTGNNTGTLQLFCSPNITLTAPAGANSMIAFWDLPFASTTCSDGGATATLAPGSLPNGSNFPLGTTTIIYEGVDACGNTASCSFTVTINGTNPTTLTLDCPSDLTFNIPAGANSITVNWALPTAQSTCQNGTGNPNCGQDLDGFTYFGTYNDHEYYISEIEDHWDDGQAAAAEFDAKLASINDEGENNFIYQNISSNALVGGTDEVDEGTFIWEDGSPLTYSNFANATQNTSNKDYIKIQGADGKWKAHSRNYKRYYIMELDCAGGANVNLTQASGPDNGIELSEGQYSITYLATDACGGEETCSFTVTVTQEASGEYCGSEGSQPWQQHIDVVRFHTLDHESGKEGYGDFTNVSTSVIAGNTYDFTLVPKFSWQYWDEYVRVWIDFNQDQDFNDPGELVLETIAAAGAPNYPPTEVSIINNSITIPSGSPSGATRMRVSMQKEAFAEPCDFFTFGEVEDYTVVVATSFNLTGAADALYFDARKAGRSVNLNWTSNAEARNDNFIAERSSDGVHFEVFQKVLSLNDVDSERYYNIVDEIPLEGMNFYRLKELFTDGSYRYSEVHDVFFDLALEGFTVFPIPTDGLLFISLPTFEKDLEETSGGVLQLYSSYGELMLEKEVDCFGKELVKLDLAEFTAGVYLLTLQVNGRRFTRKVIVVE